MKRPIPPPGEKLVLFTSLVADGRQGPLFLITNNSKVPNTILTETEGKVLILGDVDRRGERMCLAFLEWAVKQKLLEPGDLILWDEEFSFKTEWVKDFLAHHNITSHHFPSASHALLNPCDNSYHSQFHHNYNMSVRQHYPQNIEEKINLAKDAYYSIKGQSIANMMEHTGITAVNLEDTVEYLFTEGIHPSPKFTPLHQHQLDVFCQWAIQTKFKEHNRKPIALSGSSLNGNYWKQFNPPPTDATETLAK